VVDDNPFNVKSIELMLEHCFHISCDTAFSGAEALALVERRLDKLHKYGCAETYRLILTDINMPEIDGIQMTKAIRRICARNEALSYQTA
jgi:CheY-like chemotaxis protein